MVGSGPPPAWPWQQREPWRPGLYESHPAVPSPSAATSRCGEKGSQARPWPSLGSSGCGCSSQGLEAQMMVTCGWPMGTPPTRAAWRSSTKASGGLCVTTCGTCWTPALSAEPWDSRTPLRPWAKPPLGQDPALSCWTKCSARGQSPRWPTAHP